MGYPIRWANVAVGTEGVNSGFNLILISLNLNKKLILCSVIGRLLSMFGTT